MPVIRIIFVEQKWIFFGLGAVLGAAAGAAGAVAATEAVRQTQR